MELSELYGRRIPASQVPKELLVNQQIRKYPMIKVEKKKIRCLRCGQVTPKQVAYLPDNQYYCPSCILLDRMSTLDYLVGVDEPNAFVKENSEVLTWQGKLSKYQQQCSNELKKYVTSGHKHLLWAVTGAGKTEMLFELLAQNLQEQKRICLASPRVDVCNELYPRLQQAFGRTDIQLLHGSANQSYRYTQLVISTTHQLLRFYHAFDLLIIDEVDAFPFVHNRQLEYAAKQALKVDGALLYLTATPDKDLQAKIKRHEFSVSYLPMRFHTHPLPQAKVLLRPNWQEKLQGKHKLAHLDKILANWIKRREPFLLFVPRISLLQPVFEAMQNLFPTLKGQTVYANDEQRIEKVLAMRQGEFQYLVTTTILERGITFARLNILILGADDEVFSLSALVQIAGRAGRSLQRPKGDVYFVCHEYTKTIKGAIKQIKYLNQKAQRMLRDG